MPLDLSKRFVIATSSRALLDLSRENEIYEQEGLAAYEVFQRNHEADLIPPGPAFPLLKALLDLNKFLPESRHVEVVLASQNSSAATIRIRNSIAHHGLNIRRSVFTGGDSVVPYLHAFNVDLFLSARHEDVQIAFESSIASALMWGAPKNHSASALECVRIAFDGDAVLFDDESERIYKTRGMEAFHAHEEMNAQTPLSPGPFAKVLLSIAYLQKRLPEHPQRIRTALITARDSPSDERVIRTLRDHWKVHIDEMLFLGGVAKDQVVAAFHPHIFFDDQTTHCAPVSAVAPVGQVPSNLYTLESSIVIQCPRCGSTMVRRRAKKGPLAGKPFYGCGNFPRCRATLSIA